MAAERCLVLAVLLLHKAFGSGNLALNKKTIQSLTGYQGLSSYAVEGNPDPEFYHYTCSFTSGGTVLPYAWWAVDLEEVYEISHVVITKRTGHSLSDLHVEMYMRAPIICQDQPSVCTYYGPLLNAVHTLTCQPGAVGRYMMIRHTGVGVLTLCEVEVFGQNVTVVPNASCGETIRVIKEPDRGLEGDGAIQGVNVAVTRTACAVECLATGNCAAYSFNAILGECAYSAGLVMAYPAAAADWDLYRLC